jgi:hypothetical protein
MNGRSCRLCATARHLAKNLRRALLTEHAKAESSTARHLKKGITASELKSLEKKLAQALSEIQRVMEPEARP